MPAPIVIVQPTGVTAAVGATVTLHVVASGAATYRWTRRQNGSTGSAALADGGSIAGSATDTLTISGLTTAGVGLYGCALFSGDGDSASTVGVAVLLEGMKLPVVSVQPEDLTAAAGGEVTFSATVSSETPATYQWLKDGDAIGGSSVTGGTTPEITIAGVTPIAAGYYQLRVINASGWVLSEAAGLTVTHGGQTSAPQGSRPPGGVTLVLPPGAVAAGGSSATIFNGGDGVATMGNWQGIGRVAAAGNATRWLRDGNFSTPRPCGPPVPEVPFEQHGDRLTAIWRQPWRVAIESWVAEPAYAVHPDRPDYYLVKETVPEIRGAGVAIWERWYAPVPQVHYEEEVFPYGFQYIATASSLGTRTRSVTSRIKCEYFLERDEAAFPALEKDEMAVLPTTLLNSSAQGGGVTLFKTGSHDLHLPDGGTFFVSNDPWIVAEPSKITVWNHPIKCRATRYVPGPKLADLGRVIVDATAPNAS